jgi:hypothetical protein
MMKEVFKVEKSFNESCIKFQSLVNELNEKLNERINELDVKTSFIDEAKIDYERRLEA